MPESEPSSGEEDRTGKVGRVLVHDPSFKIEVDQMLAGRYKVEALVGKGATGLVVRAFDALTKAVVALKIVQPDFAKGDEWMKFLGGELRHARKIQHPNVCRVFDVGEAEVEGGKLPFLTMEFAEGGSLRAQLKAAQESQPKTERPIVDRITDARAVIDGLIAIHAAGVIHRDIKPDNVLRAKDGRLMLSDFGLAVAPGQTTFLSNYSGRVGTPSYMAPEVVMGGQASKAADVWSLGVVIHEILFGDRPHFEFLKSGRKLKSPLGPRPTRTELALVDFIRDSLSENPHDRPSDAAEARRRFDLAVEGRSGRVVRTLRRNALKIAAGAVVVAFPIVAVTVAILRGRVRDDVVSPIKVKLHGAPADWLSKSRPITTFEGAPRCLAQVPGRNMVRVIRTVRPSNRVEAVDVDLQNGSRLPALLVPEALKTGCPELSPDGRRVVYTVAQPIGIPEIFVSEDPQARNGVRIAEGRNPHWLPSGTDIVFQRDDVHVGIVSLPNRLSDLASLPTGTRLNQISVGTDRIALLSVGIQGNRFVDLVTFPERTHVRRWEFADPVQDVLVEKNGLWITVREETGMVAARIDMSDRMLRLGHVRPLIFGALLRVGGGLVITTARRDSELVLAKGGGEKSLGRGMFSNAVASARGHVLVEQESGEGRSVIAAWRGQSLEPVTMGPKDRGPTFSTDGMRFVYVDQLRTINLCELPSTGVASCRPLHHDDMGPKRPFLSPSGRAVAYTTMLGTSPRIKVAVSHGRVYDLGSASSVGCPLSWSSDESLWAYNGASREWEELRVVDRHEARQARKGGAAEACGGGPPNVSRAIQVTIRSSMQSDLRLVDNLLLE